MAQNVDIDKLDDDVVIAVRGVSKKFCRSIKRSMLYTMYDVLKILFRRPIDQTKIRKSEFLALDDINFTLKKGESLGLIGRNGCGKSTLLRIIAGIFPPSTGEIAVRGRIGALIAVGAGFHDQMSGRDNIYLNGTILGMGKEEIDAKFEEIVAFAELGDFMEAPVQTYSSGMRVRLGFSIAVHADVDILIADEVLAVGDTAFKLKCYNKMAEMRKKGCSIILVSHEPAYITLNCDRIIYLKQGKIVFDGDVVEGTALYTRDTHLSIEEKVDKEVSASDYFFYSDNPDVKVTKIELNTAFEDGYMQLDTHDDITVKFYYEAFKDVGNLYVNHAFRFNSVEPVLFSQAIDMLDNQFISLKKGHGCVEVVINNVNAANTVGVFYIALKDKTNVHLGYIERIPVKMNSPVYMQTRDMAVNLIHKVNVYGF
ncbi:MAG: ABC transporter ATP-binding protein [Spirochaetaceae bacterium]|nr:ABC transporter ATP-binding protein [Spirochaetaceae bacterium]